MNKASFTVVYDGPEVRDGVMDVKDLAPALLALGQLFDAANTVLNSEDAKIKVNVKATHPGSFEIVIDLVQSIGPQIRDFLTGDGVTAALNLKELIMTGAGVGAVGYSLITVMKSLKGRKIEKAEQLDKDTIKITFKEDSGSETSLEIPAKLLPLLKDLNVRESLQQVIEKPLQKEGLESFTVKEGKKEIISVSKNEAALFKVPEIPEEILLEQTRKNAFSIISLAFKEDNKWRLHDGVSQMSVSIEDEDFLRKVDKNQVSFSKGDILICEVKITQSRSKSGLKSDYSVMKILEHRSAARQLNLFSDLPKNPE